MVPDPLITNQVLYQLSYRGLKTNVLAEGCYFGLNSNASAKSQLAIKKVHKQSGRVLPPLGALWFTP